MIEALPWRAAGPEAAARPVDLDHMPVVLHGRPRKRWRYVGVFGERLMLCAGVVQIGVVRQAFWAVWDREHRALRERTHRVGGRRAVRVGADLVEIRDGTVQAELRLGSAIAVETASPDGDAWIWTRKQAGVAVRGTVTLAGETIPLDAPGCLDESAGFHARRTAWRWSAGVGTAADGRAVAWNLVAGLHDADGASERTVWIDGVPAEAPPVLFAPDLAAIAFASGEELTFTAEATRERHDRFGVGRSDYVQPFGTFGGSLPGGIVLAEGRGVTERHSALW